MAARDPAKVTRYQQAVNRIKNLSPDSPEYRKNLEIIKSIGTEYGLSWQNKGDFTKLEAAPAPSNTAPTSSTEPKVTGAIPDNGSGTGSTVSGDVQQGSPNADVIDPDTAGLSPEDAAAVKRLKGLLQTGETYGRNLAEEFYSPGSLGRVAEELTPDEIAALNQMKQLAATVGIQSPEMQELISSQRGLLEKAQKYSDLELEALGVARSNLDGLTPQEMEALRSQGKAQIFGQVQSATRQLAKSQAQGQVFGSAATAQKNALNRQGIQETRNLERDLMVKNIDIKQAAKEQFGNLVAQTEANRANRTNAASGQLSSTIQGDEGSRRSASVAATGQYGNLSATLGDRLSKLREFNLGQAAAEKAGQVGSIFGGIGTILGQSGLLRGEAFADKQFVASQAAQDRILEIISKSLSASNKATG